MLLLFGSVAAVCRTWCCLSGLLLLVQLVVVAVFVVSAHTVTLFLLFVLLLLPLLGRWPLKNPPLPLSTFQNVKNNFTTDWLPIDLAKSQQPIVVKITGISKKKNLKNTTEIPREDASESTKRLSVAALAVCATFAVACAALAASFAAFADPFGVFFMCCCCLVLFVLLFVQLASA